MQLNATLGIAVMTVVVDSVAHIVTHGGTVQKLVKVVNVQLCAPLLPLALYLCTAERLLGCMDAAASSSWQHCCYS